MQNILPYGRNYLQTHKSVMETHQYKYCTYILYTYQYMLLKPVKKSDVQ